MKEKIDTTNPSTSPVHQSYKCSNCGAPINYVPGNKLLYCEYCKSYSKITQEEQTKKKTSRKTRIDEHTSSVVCCHGCKATYENDKYPGAKSCIFCNEQVHYEDINERYVVQPIGLIPFGITEQQFVEQVKKEIEKAKVPSPFSNAHNVSDLRTNKVYLPCWVSTLSSPTDREQLSNPRFEYKKKFFETKNYLGANRSQGNDLLNKLGPFDRLSIVPIREKDVGNAKVIAYSLPLGNEVYVEDALSKIKEREAFLLVAKSNYGVKDWDVVLLPIYECSYTYKAKEYVIYGNGQTGSVCFDPKVELMLKNKKKRFTAMSVLTIALILITLMTVVSTRQIRKEWEREWGNGKQERFIASYAAFDMINPSTETDQDKEKVFPKIDRSPIGELTQAGGKQEHIAYKLHKMTYGDNEYSILIDYSTKNVLAGYWVMDVADLENLKTIKDKEPIIIGLRVYTSGHIAKGYTGEFNFERLEANIASGQVYKPDDFYTLLDLIACVDKEADKAVFKLEEAFYMMLRSRLRYYSEHKGIDELEKDDAYEVSYSDFSKLFQLP